MNKSARPRRVKRPACSSPEVGSTVICTETGKRFVVETDGFTFNYARDSEGRIYSDAGVDICEKRALLDRSSPFGCYVSGDSRHVTGWKGNVLGDVVESHSVRCPRRSWIHGDRMLAVQVMDVHGGMWFGRGSPGVAITLRPVNAARLPMAA